ncbi:SPOR domain-containing protein [Kitasatospora viridis]|nr:SPOR domain-containing protein [Kitasatospora viridis]
MTASESNPPTWRVMRQDDNGNRYLVARELPKDEAERFAAELEARGHKQLYWTELDPPRAAD